MDYPAEATFYVRLSFANPKEGQEENVSELTDDLIQFHSTQPGFVRGYKLLSRDPKDPQGGIARLTVWATEEDADRAANAQHVLAVRSELLQIIEEGSNVARSFAAFDPQIAKAVSGG
jgi:hypothetical protein